MHLAHPENWWLLAGWPLLALLVVFSFIRGRKILEEFAEAQILPRLLDSYDLRVRKFKEVLLLAGILFILIAMLGPQWGEKTTQVSQKGTDVIIALDTSFSMEAGDLKPSRLAVAKEALSGLIDSLQGNRIGIIGFAGIPYMFCPLTLDTSAAKLFLEEINSTLIPVPGTAIGDAIRLAVKSFPPESLGFRRLILITDGEDHHSDPLGAAQEAKKAGVVIDVIGIGSSQGEPLPYYDEDGSLQGYRKDRSGKTVVSKLDETTLKQIAAATGGAYYHATQGLGEVAQVTQEIEQARKKELKSSLQRLYEERYQIPLLLGLLLIIIQGLLPERKKERIS